MITVYVNCLSVGDDATFGLDSCKQRICNSNINTASFAKDHNACHARQCENGLNIQRAEPWDVLYAIPEYQNL